MINRKIFCKSGPGDVKRDENVETETKTKIFVSRTILSRDINLCQRDVVLSWSMWCSWIPGDQCDRTHAQRLVHSTWAELNWTELTYKNRPSNKTYVGACSLARRVSVTTWLAAAKVGRLVLSQFVRCRHLRWKARTPVRQVWFSTSSASSSSPSCSFIGGCQTQPT